jgi:hypothetical protein
MLDPPGSELLVYFHVPLRKAYSDLFNDLLVTCDAGVVLGSMVPPGRADHQQIVLPPCLHGDETCCIVASFKDVTEKSGPIHVLCARGCLVAIDTHALRLSSTCIRAFIDKNGKPLFDQSKASFIHGARMVATFYSMGNIRNMGSVCDSDPTRLRIVWASMTMFMKKVVNAVW